MNILDVSSGRGTQANYYAKEFGVDVIGVDLSEEMVKTATENAELAGMSGKVTFVQGDSQNLQYVKHFSNVLTLPERIKTMVKVYRSYGFKGILKALENEKIFYQAVIVGKIGYCLFKIDTDLALRRRLIYLH